MSRTQRFRKSKFIPWWNNYEWRIWEECTKEEYLNTKYDTKLYSTSYNPCIVYERKLNPKSQRAREFRAKQLKDNSFRNHDPGPHWFRNLYSDRPLRRFMKAELNKFKQNPEYEVQYIKKYKLDYWI